MSTPNGARRSQPAVLHKGSRPSMTHALATLSLFRSTIVLQVQTNQRFRSAHEKPSTNDGGMGIQTGLIFQQLQFGELLKPVAVDVDQNQLARERRNQNSLPAGDQAGVLAEVGVIAVPHFG